MAYVDLVKRDLDERKEEVIEMLTERGVDLTDIDDVADTISEYYTVSDLTGNDNGSYTLNRNEARGIVMGEIDDVHTILSDVYGDDEAYAEIGRAVVDDDWEGLDVSARVFSLNAAARNFAEEL